MLWNGKVWLVRLTLGIIVGVSYMWQSRVEIKHYFIAYFDHVTALQVLKRRTLVKGGVRTCWVNVISIYEFICMTPTLNGSSVLQHFEHSVTMKIRNK